MNVPDQLNYSHGYFARLPHTGADIIANLLEFPNIKAIKLVCLCHSVMTANYCEAIKLALATVFQEVWYS